MTTIYLIRHAEAEGNLYRRIHGSYNSTVTDNGFIQIEALRRRFQDVPVDAVWSSNSYRTMTTARAIYKPKGIPLNTSPELCEIHMGQWEDCTWGEKGHFEGEQLRRFNQFDPLWRAPGGESRLQLTARIESAVRRIADRYPNGTVAIFSHGVAIQQFLSVVRHLAPERWNELTHADNTAVTCVMWDGNRFSLAYEGDNSHLSDSYSTLAKQNWWRAGSRARDVNLWYRPLDLEKDREIYLCACRDVLGTDQPQRQLEIAARALASDPNSIAVAMDCDTPVGLIQMDVEDSKQKGAGVISIYDMLPEFRNRQLGVQLIGQAVSYFRPKGYDKLCLRCPQNARARSFFERYGFVPAQQPEILEKYIGYDR